MTKPQWYKDLPHIWQEVVDQMLHFISGAAIGYFSPLFSVAVALFREWWQNRGDTDNDAMDMHRDLTVWYLGALVMSLVH